MIKTQACTIAELAIAMPRAIETLERLGVDYCCNGRQTIAEACHRAGITVEELLALIPATNKPGQRDWSAEPLILLSQFIVRTHHQYARNTLATLRRLVMKVRGKHGVGHPELSELERLIFRLSAELLPHLLKEEEMLFPYIAALEDAASGGNVAIPTFVAPGNLRMMMLEHEAVAENLAEIRRVTADFTLPREACASFASLYGHLQELEADLHRHIHVENNILFPHAVELESGLRGGVQPLLAPSPVG